MPRLSLQEVSSMSPRQRAISSIPLFHRQLEIEDRAPRRAVGDPVRHERCDASRLLDDVAHQPVDGSSWAPLDAVVAHVRHERIVRHVAFERAVVHGDHAQPRRTSCHVQPPGAAPRSTAHKPGRSNAVSRSPTNTANASASFSVDREGALCGIRRRGIPIGHGLPVAASLVPTYAVLPSTRNTCSRVARVVVLERRQP